MVISNLSFKNNAIYERVNGMSWTNNGGGVIETDIDEGFQYIKLTQDQFLTASLLNNDTETWSNLGNNDFTFIITFNIPSSSDYLVPIFAEPYGNNYNNKYGVYVGDGYMQYFISKTGGGAWDLLSRYTNAGGTIPITTNTWHKLMLTRDGNMIYGYIDGVQDIAANVGTESVYYQNGDNTCLNIGTWVSGGTHDPNYFGKYKNFAFVKGEAYRDPTFDTFEGSILLNVFNIRNI